MAETFQMNEDYRKSDEYKTWVKEIQREAPHLPIPLIETAIIAHKTMPNFYKSDKNHKKVLSSTPQPPQNKGEIVVDSVHISDLTQDIIKQRQEFDEKYLNQNQTTIEEVQA
jgi:hypothetical protein